MTCDYPVLVCPKCGDEFDARGKADAAAIARGCALPCTPCIRHVATGLRVLLEGLFGSAQVPSPPCR